MSLQSDAVIDRRKLKRRLSLWRLVAVVAVAGVIAVLVAGRRTGDGLIPRDHVARLQVNGIIVEDPERDRALARAAEDRHVRAVVVHIDSPGGTVVGGETLYKSLRAVAAEKPVVAVMGTIATSGGYMAALGADRIYAHSGSLTGSIGVLLQSADVTGLLKKLGIQPEMIKSSPLKAVPNPFEPLTEEGRAATRAVVTDMYELFVDMVAERRPLTPAEARKLADGRIFTGRQALKNKLIDAIGNEDDARAWLEKEHKIAKSVPIRTLRTREEDRDMFGLVGRILGKTLFSERLTLDGLVSVWHPDVH